MDSGFRALIHARVVPRRLLLFALATLLYGVPTTAGEKKTLYAGRPLTEVLEELRGGDLEIIYSSRLVRPDMLVVEEPLLHGPTENPRGNPFASQLEGSVGIERQSPHY